MTAADTSVRALPASGSSFYTAMRILPRPRREAMYAVYAFCRAVDDIADSEGPRDVRLSELEQWRTDIDRMFAVSPPAAVSALVGPTRQFKLDRADFHAVIDGMAMDVRANLHAPDWATLDLYCDRVASAVGRLSVRIFGLPHQAGDQLAHHLGRALQLTNILRDLDEDAAIGRLYLPREALEAGGIHPEQMHPAAVLAEPGLAVACDEVAARAAVHYAEAERIMASSPRAAVRAPRLMAAAYSQILARMRGRGWASPRQRVGVSRVRLLGAVLRYGII